MLSGIEVGSLFEEQKVFEVVVWGTPEHRQSVTGVEQLPIETPSGTLVPLGDIADVRIASAPTVIRRDGVHGTIEIGASVQGRDVGAVLADVEMAIAGIDFPLESHAEVLGYTAERQAALVALIATAVGSAIVIFLLLQAAFLSWRLAALVFVALPGAVAGGVLVAIAMGEIGSVEATIGLLAVLGVAARHAVRQVDGYQRLVQDAGAQPDSQTMLRAAQEQLPPTLLSTLGTVAALLPFVVLGGRPGLEIIQPMAVVILCGLVTSTLVNLFVVPAIFLGSGVRHEPEMVNLPIDQVQDPQAVGAG
jgi:Cu/Ag efflux pump CusA